MYRNKASESAVAAFELLADQAIAHTVETRAIVSVNRRSKQTQLGDFGHQVSGKFVLLKSLSHQRNDFVVDESSDGVFDHGFVFAQFRTNVIQVEWVKRVRAHGENPGESWALILDQLAYRGTRLVRDTESPVNNGQQPGGTNHHVLQVVQHGSNTASPSATQPEADRSGDKKAGRHAQWRVVRRRQP